VLDPTESVAGFVVNGHAAIAWSRYSENGLLLNHGAGAVIEDGLPWSNAAGAGGIIGEDGTGTLEAGVGNVG